MKSNLLMSIIFLMTTTTVFAQETDGQFVYAELVGKDRAFSKNLKVHIDYGEKMTLLTKEEQKNTEKVLNSLSSMVDALNYMHKDGWELVQTYTKQIHDARADVHWIIRRDKELFDANSERTTTP